MTGLRRIKKLLATVRRRLGSSALVLMYHRVASADIDPWNLCVSPERFAEHLQILTRSYRVTSLRELVHAPSARARKGMVAITFDDGYADNLSVAAPMLEHLGMPATFFLTSGALGSGREFWWDELERLLLQTGRLPRELRFDETADGRVFELSASAAPIADVRRECRDQRPWQADPDTRLGLYYSVWQYLRPLDAAKRQAALGALGVQLNMPDTVRESHRALTQLEAQRLARVPNCEIGAHSVTHPALSGLSPEAQRWEMEQSKWDLERLLGRSVPGFAYPYGDYGLETVGVARASGFEFACTTAGVGVSRDPDRFLLPRLGVDDWDGTEFARRLGRVLR